MEQIGVVIFNYSNEGLAALQWASDFRNRLKVKSSKFWILQEVHKPTKDDTKEFTREDLLETSKKNKEMETFFNYIEPFGDNEVYGKYYHGANIMEILEKAIEELKLDTLILGMEAVGSTGAGKIDLQLISKFKCSVVLAKTDSKRVAVLPEISAAAADAPSRSN